MYFTYITTENKEEAQKVGAALIEARLAACVNILDGMTSMFYWEGKVQSENETVLIAKTRKDLAEKVTEKVKEVHSYDCPCVVFLPVENGNPDFLQWLKEETSKQS